MEGEAGQEGREGRGYYSTGPACSLPGGRGFPQQEGGAGLGKAHQFLPDKVKGEKDKEGGAEEESRTAQYLTPSCLIYTYYTGDVHKVVEEHFTKALSQPNTRGQTWLGHIILVSLGW